MQECGSKGIKTGASLSPCAITMGAGTAWSCAKTWLLTCFVRDERSCFSVAYYLSIYRP